MKTLFKHAMLAVFLMVFLFSCQQTENTDLGATSAGNQIAAADSVNKRPAPEFFIIPQNMLKDRVWLCDDGVADIFHVKNDCPVFMSCRATKRNVSLPRAIEDYGRYNCTTCSEELAHIFDEDMIRKEY